MANDHLQYVYIDDSGDPGLKLKRNSSKYLVIAGVFFDSVSDIARVDNIVGEMKKSLRWRSDYEFKFHKTSDRERVFFLTEISKLHLNIHVSVTKKELMKNADVFDIYNQTILRTVKQAKKDSRLLIRVDGEAGTNHVKKVKAYFRKYLPVGKIKSFAYVDSKKSNIIQLSDMIVGAVGAYYNKGNRRYLKIIERGLEIHE